jgi:hypothetical protein
MMEEESDELEVETLFERAETEERSSTWATGRGGHGRWDENEERDVSGSLDWQRVKLCPKS